MATCGTCKYRGEIPGTEPKSLACFRYPPTAFLVNIQGRLGHAQPSVMPAFVPVTAETPACGEYKFPDLIDTLEHVGDAHVVKQGTAS